MKSASVFLESFLDGFTMSGFLARLQRPGAPASIVAPRQMLVDTFSDELHVLPDQTVRSLFLILKKEIEARKIEDLAPERAGHGA